MNNIFKSLRTWVEINLDALECNFDAVREELPENMKILAVVKANAYGHGAIGVAKFLEDKADYLAVAATDEALELRKNGVNCPILILGHIPYGDYDNIVKFNITPTISDFYEAELLSKAAVKAGVTAPLHIAVDTGMNRIGFPLNSESVKDIKAINSLPNVEIEGIFSHFAAADMADKAYTRKQVEKFDGFVKSLSEIGVDAPIKHLYNSAAIADLEKKYDMVRQGIILYGLRPSDEVEFNNIKVPQPVMSMKTRVVQVKTLPAGECISYGCTYYRKGILLPQIPTGSHGRRIRNKRHIFSGVVCTGMGWVIPMVCGNNKQIVFIQLLQKYAQLLIEHFDFLCIANRISAMSPQCIKVYQIHKAKSSERFVSHFDRLLHTMHRGLGLQRSCNTFSIKNILNLTNRNHVQAIFL